MQDVSEIKARAGLAREKAREAESIERVNLSFSRIDLHQRSAKTADEIDEKYIDSQFQIMLACSKKHLCGFSGTFEPNGTGSSRISAMYKIILKTAKLIVTRRLISLEPESDYCDLYNIFAQLFSDGNIKQLHIQLEALHTTIMARMNIKTSTKIRAIDHRGLEMGNRLVSSLRIISSPASESTNSNNPASTLFAGQPNSNDSLKRLLDEVRDVSTKGLSLYQGIDKCAEQTLGWCDILLDILDMTREINVSGRNQLSAAQYDKIVAGVMAIKAYAQSNSGSYGIALKTSRAAWQKDGMELGNLVTLFHCTLQYELFSHTNTEDTSEPKDSLNYCTFANTLLELDGALNTFEMLSKLDSTNDGHYLQKLLDAFPLLCKLALKHKLLLLGLQRRMIGISIKVATNLFSINTNEARKFRSDPISKVFCILRAYLATFEELVEQNFFEQESKWQMDQFLGFQSTLENALDVLLLIRDSGQLDKRITNHNALAFEDTCAFLEEHSQPSQTPDTRYTYHSLFDIKSVEDLIGNQSECLWIGKRYKFQSKCLLISIHLN